MLSFRTAVLAAAFAVAATLPCRADLVGTPVTGSLTFGGGINYYDPGILGGWFVNGAGALNATEGTTVTIATGAEFGYSDGASLITADFTGTQLTLFERSVGPSGWTQTFSDPAFAGLSLVSSSFAGLTFSSSQNTLTFNWSGDSLSRQVQTYSATFNIVDPPVPEPSGMAFITIGLGAVALLSLKRRQQST